MTGVTDWRKFNHNYPLPNSNFGTLFSDASFLLFDYEVPYLDSIVVTGSISFNFKFSRDIISFTFKSISENDTLNLTYNGRNYGSLVIGSYASKLVTTGNSLDITIATQFDLNTVRFVNSRNGVYSLQSLYGNVPLVTSSDIQTNGTIISAISLPNQLKTVTSNQQSIKVWDITNQSLFDLSDNNQVNLINTTDLTGFGTSVSVPLISSMTTGLDNLGNTILIGVSYNSAKTTTNLYNCATYPWTLLNSVTEHIIGLASIGSALYGLTDTSLVSFGAYPYANIGKTSLSITGLKTLASVVDSTGSYLISSRPGPIDPNTHTQTSDLFFKISQTGLASSIGVLTYNNNFHLPTISALGSLVDVGGNSIVLAISGSGVYQIPTSAGYINAGLATLYGTLASPLSGAGNLFAGGWSVVFSPVKPVKSINQAGPSNNVIQLLGEKVINVNRTKENELTISLSVEDSLLNVNRTTTYA